MKQAKSNRLTWLLLGLTILLLVSVVIGLIQTSFARYQSDVWVGYAFQPEALGNVVLGSVDAEAETQSFLTEQAQWVQGDEAMQLSFAISNGTAQDDCATIDQEVRIRVIISADAWENDTENALVLTWMEDAAEVSCNAVAEQINPGTALYEQFGEGWILSFRDGEGNEPEFALAGNAWNYIPLQMRYTGEVDTALLQIQAVAQSK